MKDEVVFETHKLYCRIKSNKSLIERVLSDPFTYHYIPDVKLINSCENPDVEVTLDDSIKEPVQIEYPKCKVKSSLDQRELIALGEYLLERKRQESFSYYGLSSASSGLDGKAVVFWGGATHLGKTSSMLYTINKYNFDFISDEKTLLDLDKGFVVGGSRSVPIRKEIIKERLGKRLNSEEIGEFYKINPNRKNHEAYLFIYPHIDHGLEKPIFYQFKPLDFFWLLTRELSNEIRGGVRFANNFSYLLPSIDTPELTAKRIDLTKQFCEKVPCFYFQGSLEQIAEFTAGYLKK